MSWYRYFPLQHTQVYIYYIYILHTYIMIYARIWIRLYIHVQPGAISRILVVDGSDKSSSIDNDFTIDGWEAEALQDPLCAWRMFVF